MQPLPPQATAQLSDLLASTSRILNISLCYHDLGRFDHTPQRWAFHHHPACLAVKETHLPECVQFCGQPGITHRRILEAAQAIVHTCPFGLTEIVAPVIYEGVLAGVLFAGPFWDKPKLPPHKELPCYMPGPDIDDRQRLITAVAQQIQAILQQTFHHVPHARRTEILTYVDQNLEHPFTLSNLAEHLNLSPSRTGHVIRELFQRTFSDLVTAARVNRAQGYLTRTDMALAEIALRLGFADQSHFSRVFRRYTGQSPLQCRKQQQFNV